jgi:CheY-like chemotaxis protein
MTVESPPRRVLYAEDTPADRELLRLVCQQAGISVDWQTAENCAELSAMIEDIAEDQVIRPDLVILDLRLPDGLSTELLPQLRDAMPDLPVIVFSTSSDPSDRERVHQFPQARYLTKPDTLADYAGILSCIRAASIAPD